METDIGKPFAAAARAMASEIAHSRSAMKFAFKTAMLGAVAVSALSFMTNAALAACDTATITGTCSDLVLPSTAGNVDYTIGSGATVSNIGDYSVSITGSIGSLFVGGSITNSSIGTGRAISLSSNNSVSGGIALSSGSSIDSVGQAIRLGQNSVVSGGIVNNGTIHTGTDTWTRGEFVSVQSGATVNGGISNTGSITNSGVNSVVSLDGTWGDYPTTTGSTLNGGFWNSGEMIGYNTNLGAYAYNYVLTVWAGSTLNGGVHNSGLMTSNTATGVDVEGGSAINGGLINTGSILAGRSREGTNLYAASAVTLWGSSSIDFITNTGTIKSTSTVLDGYDIYNFIDPSAQSRIGTINNLQGTNGSAGSALSYGGYLPGQYNAIIYGDQYGQLAVDYDNHSGSLTFGIFGGNSENGIAASQLKRRTYVDVMTGVNVADIENTWFMTTPGDHRALGSYGDTLWMLRENIEDYSWNLEIFDVSLSDIFAPSAEVVSQRLGDLQGKVDSGAGSGYDCRMVSGQKACVALKGGYADQGDGLSSGALALLGGYRLPYGFRVGGFIEQGLTTEEPDNVDYDATMPTLGAYLAFSQHADNTGLQAKSSFAMSRGEAKLSRASLFQDGAMLSGTADVDGYVLAQTLGVGFGLDNWSVLTPYAGVASMHGKRGKYSESSDGGGVDEAFRYDTYSSFSTIGTIGLAYERMGVNGLNLRGGAGANYVLAAEADSLSATSDLAGLESLSAVPGANQEGQLFFAGYLGANYALTESQSIGLDANLWHSVGTGEYAYGLMAGWTMSFGGGEQSLGK